MLPTRNNAPARSFGDDMAASSRTGSGMWTPSLLLNTYRWKLPEKWYQMSRTLGKSPINRLKSPGSLRTLSNLGIPRYKYAVLEAQRFTTCAEFRFEPGTSCFRAGIGTSRPKLSLHPCRIHFPYQLPNNRYDKRLGITLLRSSPGHLKCVWPPGSGEIFIRLV